MPDTNMSLSVTINQAFEIIRSTWQQEGGWKIVFLLLGEPGIGKTALSLMLRNSDLPGRLGVSPDRCVEKNMSDAGVEDYRGLPDVSGDVTVWKPDAFFANLRHGTGPAIFAMSEVTDCDGPLQNYLCRIIRDRMAGDLPLTERLFIVADGNRTFDKSGANRLSTKLGNRVIQLTIEFNQLEWEQWGHSAGVGADILAFHRWKADTSGGSDPRTSVSSAIGFDPNRSINPTARAWAELADSIDRSLPPATYLAALSACVTTGPATEFVAFQQYWKQLPETQTLWTKTAELPIPKELQGQYALALYAASLVTPDVMPAFVLLMDRLNKTFATPMMISASRRCPAIVNTVAYGQWAIKNKHVNF